MTASKTMSDRVDYNIDNNCEVKKSDKLTVTQKNKLSQRQLTFRLSQQIGNFRGIGLQVTIEK
jgi:hypothetical protein